MFWLIAIFLVSSISLICFYSLPVLSEKMKKWQAKKEKAVEEELDKMFYDKNPKKIVRLYLILPVVFGASGILLFNSVLLAVFSAAVGLYIPNLILKIRDSRRRQKFASQILDAIMILSSSLKGGLSLLQALEVLQEEIPRPMSEEIGLVVRENKIGVELEESLSRLNKRMKLDELELVVNSIVVARETGGDLTKVFSRLTTTIRDNRKLKDSISTLTIQGRLQGIVMSALPFLFVGWVLTFNRHHFDIMFQSETGRMLLIAAVVLQIVGMFLIKKFSTLDI